MAERRCVSKPPHRQINNEVKFYVLWEQRLGRRLLLDHSDHHSASVLLRRLGRQQLWLWLWRLQQWVRLWVQRRLLLSRATWKAGRRPAFLPLKVGQAAAFRQDNMDRAVMCFYW